MKLNELILRRPLFVAFGTSEQTGGLTSVDLEATRDDSQVVISASDGSVAPVPGADATTAGVMTAADKAALEALPATTTREFAARADIAQATVSGAITHLRSAGYSGAGDGGGAVYTRAALEPAHALKVQSADGAWWELVPGSEGINVRQAGAVGDGVTDDSQAFKDALAGVEGFNEDPFGSVAVHRVVVPPGDYNLAATTLEIKKAVHLVGSGSGTAGVQPAILRWDANVTGIIVHRNNTIGAGVEATPSGSGSGSIIEGLQLVSAGGTIANITDATKGHGIWLRARALLRNIEITDFAGNGIHIVASAGGANDEVGNANEWAVEVARVIRCHMNGLFTDLADVNAGLAYKLDVTSSGRWGVHDSSFLGNTYVGCHASNNGTANKGENGAGESSFVEFGGRHYSANVNATEADLVATQPGANEDVWIDTVSGTGGEGIPTWQSGQPEGTYFHGGSYHTDNPNGRSVFTGCYNEINHAVPQLLRPTLYFAGAGFAPRGTFNGLQGEQMLGKFDLANHLRHDPDRDLTLTLNARDNVPLQFVADGDATSGWALKWEENAGDWTLVHSDLASRIPFHLTTALTTRTYGRSATIKGAMAFEQGFWLGNGNFRARWVMQDIGPPSSGEHAKGDMIFNYSPDVQTDTDGVDWIILGWKCTATGSPGTWQPLWTRVSTPPGL